MSDTETTKTPHTIEVGDVVSDAHGDTFRYGGPSEAGTSRTVSYDMRHGGSPTILCDPETLVPLGILPELADLNRKDPRITVANDKAGSPGSWVGSWRAEIPGDTHPRWSKTKGAATAEAARRLLIADWWANA
jgi:hypothetical protein